MVSAHRAKPDYLITILLAAMPENQSEIAEQLLTSLEHQARLRLTRIAARTKANDIDLIGRRRSNP